MFTISTRAAGEQNVKHKKVYVEYLDTLRKGQSEAYLELQSKVVAMWSGKKKDQDKNLKDIMHYLLDKGRINTTHEKIDNR